MPPAAAQAPELAWLENGHPLAAFYQGPDFPAAVNDGLQPLEQRNLPRKNPVAPDHMNAAL